METISIKEVRPLYLTKEGMPRKELLMTIEEAFEKLEKPLSTNPVERSYQLRCGYAVMSALKKFFREHHIIFIAPKTDGKVFYGFSNNQAFIDNYLTRVHEFALQYRRIENDLKMIDAGQLPLLPLKKEEKAS